MNDNTTTIEDLKLKIRQFSIDRDWTVYDPKDAKNFSVALAVEAAELMEIFMWLHSDNADKVLENPDEFTHLKEEVADVFWYLIRICDCCNIDLAEAVCDKAIKNAVKYPPLQKNKE